MAQSGPASFADGLGRLVSDIAALMTMPDADVQFLQQLQHAVVQKAKSPTPAGGRPAGAPGAPGSGAPGGAGAPAGLPGQPPGGGAANPGMPTQGAPVPPMAGGLSQGLSTSPSVTNADEMRRIMSASPG